ncbi:MAG: hypothetical protein P1U58_02280 [Verrucomicrobiales bacterium]|nr:hypothetical protein [Verrucomicrobiales bacterium]
MKSAYELAMERLAESGPEVKLTDEQRAELAAVDDKFKAKIAERELFLTDLIAKAAASGNYAELQELETQKTREIGSLKEQCEAEKEKLRSQQ